MRNRFENLLDILAAEVVIPKGTGRFMSSYLVAWGKTKRQSDMKTYRFENGQLWTLFLMSFVWMFLIVCFCVGIFLTGLVGILCFILAVIGIILALLLILVGIILFVLPPGWILLMLGIILLVITGFLLVFSLAVLFVTLVCIGLVIVGIWAILWGIYGIFVLMKRGCKRLCCRRQKGELKEEPKEDVIKIEI